MSRAITLRLSPDVRATLAMLLSQALVLAHGARVVDHLPANPWGDIEAFRRDVYVPRALEKHPNLAGQYSYRDARFATRAVNGEAHNGYQRWHIDLDAEVARWIGDNPSATSAAFEGYLRARYADADLAWRFPNGF